jgi:hypothetical protein
VEAAIRTAHPADAAKLAQVHVRSWQEAYRRLLPQAYLDGLDPAQRLPGFAYYGPSRDEDAGPGPTGEVFAIYLLPGAWGQGAGWAADGAVKEDDGLGFPLTEVRYRRSLR